MGNRRFAIALAVAGSICGVAPVRAQEDTERETLIKEAIELSGLKEQLAQSPAIMQAQLKLLGQQLPPDMYAKLAPILEGMSRPDAMLQSVMKSFDAQYDHDKFAQIVERLKSPLVVKMTALETASASANPQDVQAFVAQLNQAPPSPTRVALMHRLAEATEGSRVLGDVSSAVANGLARGMAAANGAGQASPGEIEAAVHQQTLNNAQMLESTLLTRQLFTYRTATDAELEAYIAAMEMPTGRWFTKLGNDALVQAYVDVAERMGTQLTNALGSAPRNSIPASNE